MNVITGRRLSVSGFPDNRLREMSKRADIPTGLISAIPYLSLNGHVTCTDCQNRRSSCFGHQPSGLSAVLK